MRNKGFIAITTVLIIMAVAILVGTVITLSSISEGQTALSSKNSFSALNLVEACVEDSLLSINTQNNINTTITVPTGTCSVTINSHVGANWTYTVTATLNGYTKNVQVITTRSNTLTPNSWKEQ